MIGQIRKNEHFVEFITESNKRGISIKGVTINFDFCKKIWQISLIFYMFAQCGWVDWILMNHQSLDVFWTILNNSWGRDKTSEIRRKVWMFFFLICPNHVFTIEEKNNEKSDFPNQCNKHNVLTWQSNMDPCKWRYPKNTGFFVSHGSEPSVIRTPKTQTFFVYILFAT